MTEEQLGKGILGVLERNPGASAREIAKELSVERRAVNRYLHGNDGQAVRRDENFRWFLATTQSSETVGVKDTEIDRDEVGGKGLGESRGSESTVDEIADFLALFDNVAQKTVAPNDKAKGALYITKEIAAVLHAAGKSISLEEPHERFLLKVIGEERSHVAADYYGSLRKGSNRSPEARMSLEIISQWLEPDDDFLIANIGPELFAARNPSLIRELSQPLESVAQEVLARLSDEVVRKRAKLAPKHPRRQTVSRQDFVRDQFVVRAGLNRANDTCEMPGCGSPPFSQDDGSTYLEVHHVIPLAEGGEDSLENVAALCPNCHREQHHGIDRGEKREILRKMILALEA